MDVKLTCLLLTFLMFLVKTEAAAITCPGATTQCNSTKTCIEYKYICDGDTDCEDGEDEKNCEKKESGCGDNSFKIGQSGAITSMNYPMNYTNLAHCQWYISSPDNTTLRLEFVDIFDIEKPRHDQCIYDFVSIYQMDPLLPIGRFCGAQSPGYIPLNSSKVLVEFQSDGQKTGLGFQLRWTSGTLSSSYFTETETTPFIMTPTPNAQCRDQFEYGGDLGHISSPNFGQPYETPLYCRWLIVVSPGYQISIQFSVLEIGDDSPVGCIEGWLELYDGPDDGAMLIGKYCGDVAPAALTTSANVLYVVMSAGNNTSGKIGFKASYSSVYIEPASPTPPGPLPPGCDGTSEVITSLSGYITTPFFTRGHPYLYGMNCEWILLAPQGRVFSIDFLEFELDQSVDCSANYLRIYDDDDGLLRLYNDHAIVSLAGENQTFSTNISEVTNLTQIVNLCGMMLPYSVESNSSTVILRFHSDDQYGGYGFNLTYHAKVPEVKCSSNQFQCDSLRCIPLSSVCDGQMDCLGRVDEMLCPSTPCGLPALQTEVVRIVGGTEAAEGAWPWTLSIVDKERPGHICGATLIHPKWALTAAHCFERIFTRNYEQFALVEGRHDLLIPDPGEQWRFVENVYMHREYISGTSENDIALIKLKQPFSLGTSVNVLCLPEHRVTAGTPCYITGWGETLGSCCENKLKQALVPIINFTICSGPEYYGDRLKDHMMCAGFPEGGVDSCDGDSGGPLACQTSTGDRHWELQGITSWGLLCASAKSPGVYTVVYDYITWIRQTVALNTI